jgi:hypothetical protein
VADPDEAAGGAIGSGNAGAAAFGWPGTSMPLAAAARFEATPVASGLLVSPVETVT